MAGWLCRSSCRGGLLDSGGELLGIGLEEEHASDEQVGNFLHLGGVFGGPQANLLLQAGHLAPVEEVDVAAILLAPDGRVEAMQAVRQSRTAGALEVVPRLLRVQLALEHLQERLEEAVPEHPRYLGPAALLQPRAQRKEDVEARAVVGPQLALLVERHLGGAVRVDGPVDVVGAALLEGRQVEGSR